MTSFCQRLYGGGATTSEAHVRFRQAKVAAEIYGVHYNYSSRRPTIALRSPSRLAAVEAVGPTGGDSKWERSDIIGGSNGEVGLCSYAVADQRVEGDDVAAVSEGRKSRNGAVELAVAALVTVVLGVGNRVLYKLALVPLKEYPFFLAQLATFGYVIVYFSITYIRHHAGIITDEMLCLPKTPFIVVGLLEALAAASGMASGAILSGASIPILSQLQHNLV